ncbi:MAG: PTS sugar transporter subunit IIA [Rhodopila sp.]
MDIADLLTPDRIVLDAKLRDKAHLISESARLCGALVPGATAGPVEAALMAREQLGSTGLGDGRLCTAARAHRRPARLCQPVPAACQADRFRGRRWTACRSGVRAADTV